MTKRVLGISLLHIFMISGHIYIKEDIDIRFLAEEVMSSLTSAPKSGNFSSTLGSHDASLNYQ
jgi:hypothetical protein